jgi:hypothetical protein
VLIGGIAGVAELHTLPGKTQSPAAASAPATLASAATATPTEQIVVTSGVIARVDPATHTLILLQAAGTQQVVHVTPTAQFIGDAHTADQLQAGAQAQITGQVQTDSMLLAITVVTQRGDG